MRRKILPVLILFIVLAAILFVPFDKEVVVKINATYFNSYQELLSPKNWRKWQPDINSIYQTDSSLYKLSTIANGFKIVIPQESFIIEQQSSTSLTIRKSKHNTVIIYNCSIIPDTSNLITSVVITYKTTAIKYILSVLTGTDLYKTDMQDFKKYMEDTKAYYGYYIKTGFLNEKKIVVNKKTVLTTNVFTEAAALRTRLYYYVTQKTLKQTAPLMVQYASKGPDSTQIMMGIPVDKTVRPDHEFLYMEIPATNALIVDFSGTYTDKQKVYAALERYIQDRRLHKKIAALEVFDGPLPGRGNEAVTFSIVYPVF